MSRDLPSSRVQRAAEKLPCPRRLLRGTRQNCWPKVGQFTWPLTNAFWLRPLAANADRIERHCASPRRMYPDVGSAMIVSRVDVDTRDDRSHGWCREPRPGMNAYVRTAGSFGIPAWSEPCGGGSSSIGVTSRDQAAVSARRLAITVTSRCAKNSYQSGMSVHPLTKTKSRPFSAATS